MRDSPDVEEWLVDRLLLDVSNPRLPERLDSTDQLELVRFFEREYDLEELAWSMADKGYFSEEPLLTVTDPADASRRIVVEGNRRLASIQSSLVAGGNTSPFGGSQLIVSCPRH